MAHSIRPAVTTVLIAAMSGLFGVQCDCAGGKTVVVERTQYIPVPTYAPQAEHLTDEVVFRVDPLTEDEQVADMVSVWGGELIADAPVKKGDPSSAIFLKGTYRVRLPEGMSVEDALSLLAIEELVTFVEPNYIFRAISTPDDTWYSRLWGMPKIGAPTAWDTTTGSAEIVVGIIDTGIDKGHVDLAENMWSNPGEIAGNGIDDDGNGYVDDTYGWDFCNNDAQPEDVHSHGTHVAGTVAGVGNNGTGVAGVAWTAKLMALKFLCGAGGSGSTFNGALAVRYAADNGAHLTNNSWGGGGPSLALRNAIEYAGDNGQLFIAAAGNDGRNIDSSGYYPCGYDLDNIISVAASTPQDVRAGFSNYGSSKVDLAAPGQGIYSTTPANGYGWKSGTSMATPMVSGAAAMVLAVNPELTWQQLKASLLDSVDVLGGWNGLVGTGGRLNLARAIEEVVQPPPTPGGLTAAAFGASSVDCAWDEVTEENAQGYTLFARSAQGDVLPAIDVAGADVTARRLTGLDSGQWFIAVAAYGPGGQSARSEERSVVLVDDEAPARIVDLYVAATPGPELAVEQITVDDTFGEAWSADNLLDDDPETAWAAEPFIGRQERRVLLDLGAVAEVSQVSLRPSAGFLDLFPRGFEIRLGAIQGDWTVVAKEVARQQPNGDGWRTWSFVPTDARYVELRIDDAAIHPSGLRYVVLADVAVRGPAADPGSLTATWTAPGDDGGSGTATEYQLRWAQDLRPGEFDDAELVATDAPGEAGSKEQAVLTGLAGETEIGVAVRAIDDVGNLGPLSNIATANTGAYPPGRIDDLQVFEENPGVVRLQFTAPADDGDRVASGRAAAYEARWSQRRIDGQTWPDAAVLDDLPPPKDPGTPETMVLDGLPPASIRYFIVRAVDDAGLPGPWSDEVSIDTRAGVDQIPPATVGDLHGSYRATAAQALALQAEVPAEEGVDALLDGDERTGWLEATEPGVAVRFTLSIGDEARPLTRVRVMPHFLFPGDFPTDVQVVVTDTDSGQEVVVASKAGHRAEPGGWLQLDLPPTPTQRFHLDVTPRERFGVAVIALAEVEAYEALPGGGVASLTWIAPGDDGYEGTATAYSVRRAPQEIDGPQAFVAAQVVPGVSAPRPGGDLEVFQVAGLAEGDEVWFALNAVDEAGNFSQASNSVQVVVPSLPPAAVADLQVVEAGPTTLTLTWTAPDPRGGALTEYDLRYVAGQMTPEAFAAAQQVPTQAPGLPGAVEEIVVAGLASDTAYSFAVVAHDGGAEDSGMSNVATGRTLDGTPPAAVANLVAIGGLGDDEVRLSWTAPGDDGDVGTATRYEVRYAAGGQALQAFDEGELADIGGAPPLAAGQGEQRTVSGLLPETDYAFALVSWDELDNRSDVSNIAVTATPGVPPAAIADLRITEATDSSLTLTWTAPGDDGVIGAATAYELRHSTQPIDAGNFADALPASAPQPAEAGTSQGSVIVGFDEATEHHFRIVAIDDRGNRSALSNEAVGITLDITAPDRVEDLVAEPMGLSGGRVTGAVSERSGAFNEASEASFAIDGNPASIWLSERTVRPAPAHLVVDLGEPRQVGRVRLLPASAYTHLFPSDWRLEVQDPDSGQWRTAIVEEGAEPGEGEWIDREFAPIGGQLVRLSTPASRPEGARFMTALAELELFESDPGAVSAALSWTAPADNGPTGAPVAYELRHADAVLDEGTFDQGELAAPPSPGAAGLPQSWVVGAMQPETTYHFAIVSIDGAGNRSLVSNDAEVTTRGLPPGTVTDLRLVQAGEDRITLAWTAPGADGDEGQADSYDLRRSGGPLNPQTWPDATPIPDLPAPLAAGADEQFEVTGLQASTTYRFALRAFEGVDDGGALSNVVEVRTEDPPERIPPARVADLAVAQHPSEYESLIVTFTATGDDDVIGTATGYDLRWSVDAIDSAQAFAGATAVQGLAAPKPVGGAELFIVGDMPREREVFFALVVLDEEDNASPMSDDASAETRPWPPEQIVDLAAAADGPDGARLTWTAPGGDGDEGTADRYEVYSARAPFATHQLINMDPLPAAPQPGAAGQAEELVVRPLDNDATVFFAVRAIDDKGNIGVLSPLAQIATPDRIPPGQPLGMTLETSNLAGALRLGFDSPGDDDMVGRAAAYEIRWALQRFNENRFDTATLYDRAVSTVAGGLRRNLTLVGLPAESEIWVALRAVDEEGLQGAISEVVSARTADSPPARIVDLAGAATAPDRVRLQWTAPGDDGSVGTATSYETRYALAPLTAASWATGDVAGNPPAPVAAGGDQIMDVTGLDSGTRWYFAVRATDDRGNVGPVSNTVLVPTPDITSPGGVDDLAAEPGPFGRTLALSWTATGDDGDEGRVARVEVRYAPTPWPGWDAAAVSPQNVVPVMGGQEQSFVLQFLSDELEYGVAIRSYDEADNAGTISNVATGWTPSVAPGAVADLAASPDGLGVLALTFTAPPDNAGDNASGRVVGYELAVSAASFTPATFEAQELRAGPAPVDPGAQQALRVEGLANDAPYWIAIRAIDDRGGRSAVTRVVATRTSDEIPPAAVVSLVAHAPRPAGGALAVAAVAASAELSDEWPAEATIDADPGTAWASPPGEGAGSSVELTLATAAWVGSVRLTVGEWPDRFPVDFSVEAGGAEVASVGGYEAAAHTRVEVEFTPVFTDTVRVVMERSGGDDGADYAIVNEIEVLPADDPPDTIRLSWVAPGDDGAIGQATTYDARYSLAPINAGNFEAADEVGGLPAPAPAGQPQSVGVGGLAEETEYHFALISEDEAGNRSLVSNAVAATTLGIPPAPVTDLVAVADGPDAVELTWTATGADRGIGQATSYEVRYRPYDLSDATWDDGLVADAAPAPAAAGGAESMRVDGLLPGTVYAFALRVTDDRGHTSLISNVPNALTDSAPDVVAPAAIDDLQVRPAGGNGLPLAIAAVASSGAQFPEFPSDAATDGDPDTAWASPADDQAGEESLTLTLAGLTTIDEIRLRPHDDFVDLFPAQFVVEGTANGDQWDELVVEDAFVAEEGTFHTWAVPSGAYTDVRLRAQRQFRDPARLIVVAEMAVFEAADRGTVTLSFTAPGDDDDVGTANRYLLATSTNGAPIDSEDAWAAAAPTATALAPLQSGVVQALTLQGLGAGQHHFALRAEDEAGNLSPLGNSPVLDID